MSSQRVTRSKCASIGSLQHDSTDSQRAQQRRDLFAATVPSNDCDDQSSHWSSLLWREITASGTIDSHRHARQRRQRAQKVHVVARVR
jgi:hypothetical protein